jgi:hypothetical protein
LKFEDEDWTGLTKKQIKTRILAEIKEKADAEAQRVEGFTAFNMFMDLVKEVEGMDAELKGMKHSLENLGVKMNALLAEIAKLRERP